MTKPANDPIQQAAVDWFVRLQGEASLEDWTAFQAWLEATPAHAAAYQIVETLWVELEDESLAEPMAAATPDNVVALPQRQQRPKGRWLWVSGAAAAAAAAAVVLALAPQLMAPSFTDYATQRGQTREIALADGSRLTLGSATALRVRLSPKQRDVTLVEGEASFDIAHEADRPFVIGVADRQVRVLGTEFNILSHANRLAVTVRRGVVAVSGGSEPEVRLVKGQQLTHIQNTATSSVRRVDPDTAFAWKSGKLVYRDAPLTEVAADLNRYVATPIRVDPSAASVKVSGVLLIDKEAAMIRRLELFAPIVSQVSPDLIVLKAKATHP